MSVLNIDTILAAVEDSTYGIGSAGFCLTCGLEYDDCEPDARGYQCDECDTPTVYGAEECLLRLA